MTLCDQLLVMVRPEQHETTRRLLGKRLKDGLVWGWAGFVTERNLIQCRLTLRINSAFV